MPLLAVGISHKTAPLDVRERLAFSGQDCILAARALLALPAVEEAVLVSTCNRTEVYALVSPDDTQAVLAWLLQHSGITADRAREYFYQFRNQQAVTHLFNVASGLDSLVLGEPQILGQLKAAWQSAREAGSLGKITDRLFQRAFATGKQIRNETGISSHPVSVAYIATVLARQIFGDLTSKTVLMVGAGEMIELCGRHFAQQGVKGLIIANRSLAKARSLADQFDAEAVILDDLEEVLARADIVISSTASKTPIITSAATRTAMVKRRHKPVFLVDIAVPRDVEPAVTDIDGAYLYTIDDLQQVADENRSERNRAAESAGHSVSESVLDFMRWLHGARAADSLHRLRNHAELSGEALAMRAVRQLQAGHDPEQVVGQMATTLTHRILHGPTKRLREAAEEEDYDMLKAADWLFDAGLEPVDEEQDESAS